MAGAASVGVGYFDDGPVTDQVVSRAVAAQQDLAVRTQALANRAPDLLARLGSLKGDIDLTTSPPAVSAAPATPAPAASPPKPAAAAPLAPKPAPAKPVPAKPVAAKPVPAKPVAAKPVAAKPVPAKQVAAQPKPAPAAPPASTTPAPRYDPVDALDRLRALATMLDEGLIDRSEFDAKKAKILDRL